MGAASAAEVAAMDRAVREVRAQYARAKVKVDANTGGIFAALEAQSIRKAFLGVGVVLEKWASTYRTWAVLGKREDGSEYTVQRFLDFGKTDVAGAVEGIAGEAYDRSLFAAVKATVEATAGDVKKAVTSPVVLWTAAAVVGLVVVVAAAALLRR